MASNTITTHPDTTDRVGALRPLGERTTVVPYLEKCQVDTPPSLIRATWHHVWEYREHVGKVVDFGAGDGRFSHYGTYDHYIGYEIDEKRCHSVGPNAMIINSCAFEVTVLDADLCIGNPPFVRNQELPRGWRTRIAGLLRKRTGVTISGLANAWQYFFLLSLASTKPDGLCVLVIPYEWVSRPSAAALRSFITTNKWVVDVYRLVDHTFKSVLTTASITIIDKSQSSGKWRYFEQTDADTYKRIQSASGASDGVLNYVPASSLSANIPRARRGLSPGTQKVFVLTEGERVSNGLRIYSDVVPCVTTLRPLRSDETVLDKAVFDRRYRQAGKRCWLIRTDRPLTTRLRAYIHSVPENARRTKTCIQRDIWWMFKMPRAPDALMSQSFKADCPKAVDNSVRAIAVGGVCGVSNLSSSQLMDLVSSFSKLNLGDKLVSYANGLRKLEINQLNGLLQQQFTRETNSDVR